MKLSELFSNESCWTQETFARTADGTRVAPKNPDAICWCLRGGIEKCYGHSNHEANTVHDMIHRLLGIHNITYWNDHSERIFKDIKDLVTELKI